MCLQCVLIRFTLSIILLHPPSPFLRTISTGFIVLFSYMNIKHIDHNCLPWSTPFTLPPPVLPTSGQDLFYLPALHFFFKCILIVQESFALVFQTCIHCTLIRLFLTLSLLPCSLIIQQLSVHFSIPSSYADAMYFLIIHSLSFFFSLPVSSDKPTTTITFSLLITH
jgi:hypothetical protein